MIVSNSSRNRVETPAGELEHWILVLAQDVRVDHRGRVAETRLYRGSEPEGKTLSDALACGWCWLADPQDQHCDTMPLFGEVAVSLGYLTPAELAQALTLQEQEAGARPFPRLLGMICRDLGFLSLDHIGVICLHQLKGMAVSSSFAAETLGRVPTLPPVPALFAPPAPEREMQLAAAEW